jgi:hypothetical protein
MNLNEAEESSKNKTPALTDVFRLGALSRLPAALGVCLLGCSVGFLLCLENNHNTREANQPHELSSIILKNELGDMPEFGT